MLPIIVTYDSGLDDFERYCIESVMKRFEKEFPKRSIYIYGDRRWSNSDEFSYADWYVKVARKFFRTGYAGIQVDAVSLLRLLEIEPWQNQNPHIDVFFTSKDLNVQGMNFCFGMTRGRNTVQSSFRYRGLYPEDRKIAIETVIWHELGHVFGLASDPRRSNTEEKYGRHCKNHGCVMRQGVTVEEWVRNAKEAKYAKRIYCQQCMEDMMRTRI